VTQAHGLVIVDKPTGWTSHDVVAKTRRLAGTRKVGHAGTLDPMATGVLVLGVGAATKLLGHLTLATKAYDATIRLGVATVTDDAEGELVSVVNASGVSDQAIRAVVGSLTGQIQQVPSKVSAVKIDGVRSYKRVRSGEDVEIPARTVTVSRFDVTDIRHNAEFVDVDAVVECSSGTYIRALARDIGQALEVGGHLTRLRRTRVGPYELGQAHTLNQLEASFVVLPLSEAASAAFPCLDVDAATAARVAHGGYLPATDLGAGPVAVFGPDGELLALVEDRGPRAKYLTVFAPE
jgi:tRNA pseudouridine55 synthase